MAEREKKMAQQCGIGITGMIHKIQIHLGHHAVHGYRDWSMKILVQCLLGFALSKSLTESRRLTHLSDTIVSQGHDC